MNTRPRHWAGCSTSTPSTSGVELGKKIASRHEALLSGASATARDALDPSIRALLERLQRPR
ncbi:MAG: hypothetical protein R3E68_14870 [Burkholderiaceae bacterium]